MDGLHVSPHARRAAQQPRGDVCRAARLLRSSSRVVMYAGLLASRRRSHAAGPHPASGDVQKPADRQVFLRVVPCQGLDCTSILTSGGRRSQQQQRAVMYAGLLASRRSSRGGR